MAESRPIEVAFDAKQKMAGLKVIAGLNAADEFGQTAIKIVIWNIQTAVSPRTTKICSNIKS
jgi:hypothetical protein